MSEDYEPNMPNVMRMVDAFGEAADDELTHDIVIAVQMFMIDFLHGQKDMKLMDKLDLIDSLATASKRFLRSMAGK